MLNGIMNRIAEFAERHSSAIIIGNAIWFWLGVAVYARFIPVPEFLSGLRGVFFWASVGANALWWGYFHGKVQARRKAMLQEKQESGTPID